MPTQAEQNAIYRQQRIAKNSKSAAETMVKTAVSYGKFHFEKHNNDKASMALSAVQPMAEAIAEDLSKIFAKFEKGEYDANQALQHLHDSVKNGFNHAYIEPLLKAINKAKSYF
jgi:hypothetical protein